MDGEPQAPSLLNVFEVDDNGRSRHLICFLAPTDLGEKGIESRAVVGEYTPGPGDVFIAESFALNPDFLTSITGYMNDETAHSPDLVAEATRHAGGPLFLLDPRAHERGAAEPPPADVLGRFTVDDAGRIVPGSFEYNGNHLLFDPTAGPSAVLYDRRFYDWLHPGEASLGGEGEAMDREAGTI